MRCTLIGCWPGIPADISARRRCIDGSLRMRWVVSGFARLLRYLCISPCLRMVWSLRLAVETAGHVSPAPMGLIICVSDAEGMETMNEIELPDDPPPAPLLAQLQGAIYAASNYYRPTKITHGHRTVYLIDEWTYQRMLDQATVGDRPAEASCQCHAANAFEDPRAVSGAAAVALGLVRPAEAGSDG